MAGSPGKPKKMQGADDAFVGDLYGELNFVDALSKAPRRNIPLLAYIPGLLLCGALALAATWLSDHYGMPAILIGLLLGLALSFTTGDERSHPGLDLAAGLGLRIGIALIGIQVTVQQIAEIGLLPLLALMLIMGVAFAGGIAGARVAGHSRYSGILAGGATAICGASAAVAIYGVIGKDRLPQAQFSITLVGVALASALAMTFYPVLATQFGLDDKSAGFMIGAAVHDVAQAIGGGYSYSDVAGVEATIVKLARVAMLAPIVLVISLWIGGKQEGSDTSALRRIIPPWFILAFLALVVVNSLVSIPTSYAVISSDVTKSLLLVAITATALRSRTDQIRDAGFAAFVPVFGATLASFLAAFAVSLLLTT